MGCNTSSEAKTAKETGEDKAQEKSQENHTQNNEASEANNQPVSEEQAATKIQAVFRGHQTRKSISMKAASKQAQPEPEPTRAELEAEFRPDDKELCNAATKIQASFRGHQARKLTQAEIIQAEKDKAQALQDKEDIEKIDMEDPNLNKAATKIQASFRGHKVRKEVQN
ncbi:uncharacterized protein LOC113233573 [Hyposmocoma kahamanoa]|uniref:uncharacterized protein LOC113233573 n=1 Tax=Hyposmocoma kahamanoa TaxID=1477025 RepID=UPI000E6D691B|nr:uncharacterized protein LOC113233573 [Hyposmocoma kahamanoa]